MPDVSARRRCSVLSALASADSVGLYARDAAASCRLSSWVRCRAATSAFLVALRWRSCKSRMDVRFSAAYDHIKARSEHQRA
jgi:hypothetical protein